MKLLMLAASLRRASFNKQLIDLTASIAKRHGIETQVIEFKDYELPFYNADDQDTYGLPHNAEKFIKDMHSADGLILAVPEYNYAIPGVLKNLIDWVSRAKPMPWAKQQILLMSASPSLVGGNRGLWSTRVPLEACGAFVFPNMFSLASSHQAFSTEGQLTDTELQKRLEELLLSFTAYLAKVK